MYTPGRTAPDLLALLGQAERYALLGRLAAAPTRQKELVAALTGPVGLTQPNASKHLRELRTWGLVERDRLRDPYRLGPGDEVAQFLAATNALAAKLS